MKKVAVFFKLHGAKSFPFTKNEYWTSYRELALEVEKFGGEFYIVRENKTYLGNGRFSNSWQFKDGDLIETGEITVDKIYDKGRFNSDNTIPVLNNNFVNDICTDKFKTFEIFKEFCPQTIKVNNEDEFLEALSKINGEKKVIKPVGGYEGLNVFIGNDEYLKNCEYEFPLLVQEFLNSSCGIDGITDGIHDFRIAILGGEVVFSYLRTPPPNELLSNVARGGSQKDVKIENIPKEALKIALSVDSYFKKYKDRFISVDLAFTENGPKIIELNSRTGLDENARGNIFKEFKEKLAKLLVN